MLKSTDKTRSIAINDFAIVVLSIAGKSIVAAAGNILSELLFFQSTRILSLIVCLALITYIVKI